MESLGDILARVMEGEALERKLKHPAVFRNWARIVGPLLARRCWPVSVRKGVLLVRVAGPVWMQELQFQKTELLKKVTEAAGPGQIEDIRFTLRGARSAASKRGMACVQEPFEEKSLNPDEKQWVEKTSKSIEDPALRNSFKRILEHHLRARRRK